METVKSKTLLGLSTLILSLNVYASDIDVAMYDEAYAGLPGNSPEPKVSTEAEIIAENIETFDCNDA